MIFYYKKTSEIYKLFKIILFSCFYITGILKKICLLLNNILKKISLILTNLLRQVMKSLDTFILQITVRNMAKKHLGALVISLGFASTAFSHDYNARLLQEYADDFSRKLWAHTPIRVEEIQEDLNFVYKSEALAGRFEKFEDTYEKLSPLFAHDTSLSTFACYCADIYASGDDETKVALRMLFKAVSDKYMSQFKRLHKLRKAKEEPEDGRTPQLLGKADKTAPLDYPDAFLGVKVY